MTMNCILSRHGITLNCARMAGIDLKTLILLVRIYMLEPANERGQGSGGGGNGIRQLLQMESRPGSKGDYGNHGYTISIRFTECDADRNVTKVRV